MLVVAALALVQLGSLARPAYACGCGGMVPSHNTTVAVRQESSVVRWDGGSEQIVISLTVHGDAPEAAWITGCQAARWRGRRPRRARACATGRGEVLAGPAARSA
jgi:hypothetical protein